MTTATSTRSGLPVPGSPEDMTWKLAQEDTFWTRCLPTFLLISYSLWARKIIKLYYRAVRAWVRGSK